MMNLALVHRITKIILSISISLFFLFVGIDNLLNFNANYQFVQHVLAMNSMQLWFDASTLEYRTVQTPPFNSSAIRSLFLLNYWQVYLV